MRFLAKRFLLFFLAAGFVGFAVFGESILMQHRSQKARFPHQNSNACLKCHVLSGWHESQHYQEFSRLLKEGKFPQYHHNACLFCHIRHALPVPPRITRFAFLRHATIGGVTAVHTLCQKCHTSPERHPIVPAPDIQDQFEKFYVGGSAMPLIFPGHKVFIGKHPQESVLLGSKLNEFPHIECTDCHNPHLCNRQEPLRGAKGIMNIGGKPVAVGYGTTHPMMNPPVYAICFRCHGPTYKWITPYPDPPYDMFPPGYTNKFKEFNPKSHMFLQPKLRNTSWMPVVFPGKNRSKWLNWQLKTATHGKLTVHSTIECTDCHNNNAFSKVHGRVSLSMGTYKDPVGPHGSIYNRILRTKYTFKVGTATRSPFTHYNPKDFALCFNCHNEKAFDGGRWDKHTGFYSKTFGNLHYLHLTGDGGKLPVYESCMECHYDAHSNVMTDTTLFIFHGIAPKNEDTHLIWFYPGVKGLGNNPYPEWIKTAVRATCLLVCHDHVMNFHYSGPDLRHGSRTPLRTRTDRRSSSYSGPDLRHGRHGRHGK